MPLDYSGTKASIEANIKTEMKTKPRRQAIAIALDVARRAKKAMASGGALSGADWVQRTQAHMMSNKSAPKPPQVKPPTPLAIKGGLAAATPLGRAMSSMPKVGNVKPQFPKLPTLQQASIKLPKLAKMKDGGEVPTRTEPFSSGGIIGTSGGTDDKVHTRVANDSFIIPSRVTAALGDGNSLAGMAKLHQMFPPTKAVGGAAAKKDSVDVALSDGETSIDPQWVKKIGNGDYDKGHRILKAFCEEVIRREIEALKALPAPTLDKNS